MGNSNSSEKSFYDRYQDKRRGPPLNDDDIKKYTGRSHDEITEWAETAPGVGKNQLAGKISVGGASGLGGVASAEGYGGGGYEGQDTGANRGLKYPPQKTTKKVVDESE